MSATRGVILAGPTHSLVVIFDYGTMRRRSRQKKKFSLSHRLTVSPHLATNLPTKTQKKDDFFKSSSWRCVGDSNCEAVEPIPTKKSAGENRAINHFNIGSTPLIESAATQRQEELRQGEVPSKAGGEDDGSCGLAHKHPTSATQG